MKKLEYIDALRGLAILGVIMIHTSVFGTLPLQGTVGNIVQQGSRGVQLFYLVSAFTLFLSFESSSSKERFPVRNFFIRRFFRIAPMYYLAICYYLFQFGLGYRIGLGDQTHITASNIIGNFLFLHGFNPYWMNSIVPGGWSIGVEMFFYTLLPFLFLKIRSLNHAFNFFIITLFVRLFLDYILIRHHLITAEGLWSGYLFYYFPSQLPVFALGIIMYFLINQHGVTADISGKSLLIFAFVVIFQLLFIGRFTLLPYHVLFGVAFLILAISLSKYKPALLVNPATAYIGKISYSMYLVHNAVLHWLSYYHIVDYSSNRIINYGIRFLITLALTVLISSVLFTVVEMPLQRVGKKIIDKLERKYFSEWPLFSK